MKQSVKFVHKIYWVFPAVGFFMAAVSYPFLPEKIVTHWDFSGTPDQTIHKAFLFVIPLVLAFCVFVFTWLPAHSKQKNAQQSGRETTVLHVVFFLILLLAETITIAYALGFGRNVKLMFCLAIGTVFVILGNFVPKFQQNRWVGFRNSQTMKNKTVWYRTQRLAGKVMMASGACMLAAGLTPMVWSVVLLAVSVGAIVVIPLIYSLVIAKRHGSDAN